MTSVFKIYIDFIREIFYFICVILADICDRLQERLQHRLFNLLVS